MVVSLLKAEWRLKLSLTVLFNLLFWSGYEVLGRHAFFPLRAVPMTWLDRAVPFQPEPWAWVYLSQFTFTSTLPWLLSTRDAIRRYATGLVVMTLTSFLIFLFLPTPCLRPAQVGGSGAMKLIVAFDGLLNAFPSLHATFLAYMSALAWRMFGRAIPMWGVALWALWGTAIMYATLATKQHYALDLAAGGLLGWTSDWLAWRGVARAQRRRCPSTAAAHPIAE